MHVECDSGVAQYTFIMLNVVVIELNLTLGNVPLKLQHSATDECKSRRGV